MAVKVRASLQAVAERVWTEFAAGAVTEAGEKLLTHAHIERALAEASAWPPSEDNDVFLAALLRLRSQVFKARDKALKIVA